MFQIFPWSDFRSEVVLFRSRMWNNFLTHICGFTVIQPQMLLTSGFLFLVGLWLISTLCLLCFSYLLIFNDTRRWNCHKSSIIVTCSSHVIVFTQHGCLLRLPSRFDIGQRHWRAFHCLYSDRSSTSSSHCNWYRYLLHSLRLNGHVTMCSNTGPDMAYLHQSLILLICQGVVVPVQLHVLFFHSPPPPQVQCC